MIVHAIEFKQKCIKDNDMTKSLETLGPARFTILVTHLLGYALPTYRGCFVTKSLEFQAILQFFRRNP